MRAGPPAGPVHAPRPLHPQVAVHRAAAVEPHQQVLADRDDFPQTVPGERRRPLTSTPDLRRDAAVPTHRGLQTNGQASDGVSLGHAWKYPSRGYKTPDGRARHNPTAQTRGVLLPTPTSGSDAAVEWVRAHLGDLCGDDPVASDGVLAALDLTGYAGRRNNVLPRSRRGASMISPYVRHGLIDLPRAWDVAAYAPPRDRGKFRDELAWQEYARHLYARVGRRNATALRAAPARAARRWGEPWPAEMNCVSSCVEELYN